MLVLFKKVLFTLTLNSILFLLLVIGIQNSSNRSKVNILIGETISLPVSFIVGISFISGSISGSLLTIDFRNQKRETLK
tara:strand:+ start:713 stop:949 length:237 start_codon:yes stop_codon:yes gene_type:complete